jgi:TonB family protein
LLTLLVSLSMRCEPLLAQGIYVEQMPEYQGGPGRGASQEKLLAFLRSTQRWPDSLRHIEGKVFVSFVVDTTGGIQQSEVLKGLHPQLDAEALRLVSLLHFEPGRQNGKPVAIRYTLPVAFQKAPPKRHRRLFGN